MENPLLKDTIDFRKVFDTLPVLFLIIKPDAPCFTVLEANSVFLKTSGLQRENILNRPLFDVLPDDEAVRSLRRSLEKVLLQKSTDHLPIQSYSIRNAQTGVVEELYWLPKNTPVLDEKGEIDYIIHHVENMTETVLSEKRRKEEARVAAMALDGSYRELDEVNKELDSFTYSVSHDLRAPLRAINGYSRMILEDNQHQLSQDTALHLNTIINNAMRMGALIDDLLSFSRLGKQSPTKVQLNMNAIADSVLSELMISQPGHIIINIRPLAPAEADSSMIRLVMTHLIANALKYSHKKEQPVIEIGCIQEGERTIYYVKDNGAGFDMKYYDKLFGVFNRLHNKHEFEGTGVGLALVDRIMKKHDGEVWGEGKTEEGATFYFSLPAINNEK